MKTKPITVRLDEDHLAFLKKREKIDSNQKAIDFILKAYWDVWHVAPNPFAIEKQKEPDTPVVKPIPKPTKTLAQYATEKKELESQEQYNKWLSELKADENYSDRQKESLIKYTQP